MPSRTPRRGRTVAGIVVAGLAVAGVLAPSASASTADNADATYTITVGDTGTFAYPTDTPASSYTDSDGTFYFQQSASLYGASDPHYWDFFTGTNFDTATRSSAISDAVNPANSKDANNDTVWRCNNSPTGTESTYAPSGSSYAERNYCDLVGVWVDPDTGDWYGLVHDEFTPEPFGAYSFSHYDSIDMAVSTDHGKVWTIKGHVLTSPYSTTRGDTTAFPNETFYYGDGDPRLFVDPKSGYFYVYYGSRVVPKAGAGGNMVGMAHVARAPISAKMATGSWRKWYDGSWSQPGIGGKESNMVPVSSANPNGYTAPDKEYNPNNTGNVDSQVAAGKTPPKSPLFVMNITYDAYLGEYVGEPEAVNGNAPQQYYVTDDLATQKWRLAGSAGDPQSSWYRWILDSANRTNPTIVGKTFAAYCAISCTHSDGEWADVTIDSSASAATPVRPGVRYQIDSGSSRVLAQNGATSSITSLPARAASPRAGWTFVSDGDGSFQVINAATGQALGVDSSTVRSRAWGTKPTVSARGSSPTVGQQWFIVPDNASRGAFRLVNRYSGLVLGLSSNPSRLAETTPTRSWADTTGSRLGGHRSPAEQLLTFRPVR